MKEPMCNYVFTVPGSKNYQFRRKIPQDLIPHYKKKEIKKSLRTSNKREAEKLSRIEASRLDAEWDELRKVTGKAATFQPRDGHPNLPSNSVEDTTRAKYYGDEIWTKEAKIVCEKVRASLPPLDLKDVDVNTLSYHLLSQLRALNTLAVKHGVVDRFVESARRTLGERKLMLETGDLDPYGLDWNESAQVSEAIRNAYQAFLTGTGPTVWFNPIPLRDSGAPTESLSSNGKGISLFSLLDKWAAEQKRNLKTVDMYNRTVTRFRELVQKIAIHDITRLDVVRFKDKLLEIGQSPANTKKQLVVIKVLLNYAVSNAFIATNPATGVTINVEQKEKPRVAFDAVALNAIFASPVYSNGLRPKAGAGEAAYWLPLLALFTGARLEELGQLHPSDVMEETYYDAEGNVANAWVIRIKHSEKDGQGVKSVASNRRIPIHAKLIDLGFLTFALQAKQGERARIFGQLMPDKFGTETAQWSKWFGRYLRKVCKVLDERMTFHSFRHSFKDYCRLAEIEEDVHDRLTGHTNGSVASSYGSDRYPLRPLLNAMKKYQVAGLDFSWLKSAT
jgi:integrase